MKENFHSWKAGDPITDTYMNRVSKLGNRLTQGVTGSHVHGIDSDSMRSIVPVGAPVLIAQIMVTQTQDLDDAESSGVYECRPIWYDHDDSEWQEVSEDQNEPPYLVDAFAYGEGLRLITKDVFSCLWHEQRGAWIPINPPVERRVVADAEVGLDAEGQFSIWKYDSQNNLHDTGRNLPAHHTWMHKDDATNVIAAGSECLVRYYQDSERYVLVNVECPAS